MALAPGGSPDPRLQLGCHTLISEISRGTYGRLWSGAMRHDSGQVEAVLLRRLWKKKPLDGTAIERVTEAAVQAMGLRSAHVARVLGVEQTETELAIAQEFSNGKDLRSLLSLAPIKHLRTPPPVAVHVALSALEALDEVARELPEELRSGMLSPDSLFFAADGKVRILDAGVASALSRNPGAGKYEKLAGYAAPEEFEDQLHAKSDVFRLGILIWEMLSTQRLFGGVTTFAEMEQVKNREIPELDAADTPGFAALVGLTHKALARDVDARPSLDEFRGELEASGITRATEAELAAHLEQLAGVGLNAQRRAVAAALGRIADVPVIRSDRPPATAPPAAKESGRRLPLPVPLPVRPPNEISSVAIERLSDSDLQRDSELPTAIQPPNADDLDQLIQSSDEDLLPLDGETTDVQRTSELPTAIKPPTPAPAQFAKLQGHTATGTLLGVPAPAFLPAQRPPSIPPSSVPPRQPSSPLLASAPLEAVALDDLEGELEPSGSMRVSEISMVEVFDEPDPAMAMDDQTLVEPRLDMLEAPPPAAPLHPMFQKKHVEDDDLSFAPPRSGPNRKYIVGGAVVLCLLLLGVAVLAAVGGKKDEQPSAGPSATETAAAPPEPSPAPPAESMAKVDEKPAPKAAESAEPEAESETDADGGRLALADADGGTEAKGLVEDAGAAKPLTAAEKKAALLAEKKEAEKKKKEAAAEKKKAAELAAKEKAALAKQKKKEAAALAAQKKKEAALAASEKKKKAAQAAREKAAEAAKKKQAAKAEKLKKKKEAAILAYEKAQAAAKKKREALAAKQKAAAEKKAKAAAAKKKKKPKKTAGTTKPKT